MGLVFKLERGDFYAAQREKQPETYLALEVWEMNGFYRTTSVSIFCSISDTAKTLEDALRWAESHILNTKKSDKNFYPNKKMPPFKLIKGPAFSETLDLKQLLQLL